MTEDNTTEASESQEGASEEQDSPVITAIREENRKLKKKLDSQPTEAELLEKARAVVAREQSIESQLVAAGVPSSVRSLVEEKLGDAEVTPEGVNEALTALGFQVTSEDSEGGEETQQTAENLSEVANLGTQVAQAAKNQVKDTLTDKINAAETPEELAQIMREAEQG